MTTLTRECPTQMDRYGDEVLNANDLPQMLLAALGLQARSQTVTRRNSVGTERDAEDFMKRLYRAQE